MYAIRSYYDFATLAPFIAGLLGIGYYYLANAKKYWFAVIFIPAALAQLYIQWMYKDWFAWLLPISAIVFAAATRITSYNVCYTKLLRFCSLSAKILFVKK